jgi:dihydropyrimidinase
MGVLIQNGTLVTSLDKTVGDILCRDGQIVAIGKGLDASSGDTVIDASGQLVLPGGIDPHVHMELPFMGTVSADDFETGTAAGVAGGTTSIIDFVIPGRNDSYPDTLKWWYEKAEKSVADYAFHQAITWWGDDTASYMQRCVSEEGIPSFKTFMAYRGAIGIDDVEMIAAMKAARALGAMITVHAEHGDMVVELQNKLFEDGDVSPRAHARSRPAPVEGEATSRAIMLARMTHEPVYIVHVTCVQAVEAIASRSSAFSSSSVARFPAIRMSRTWSIGSRSSRIFCTSSRVRYFAGSDIEWPR